MTDLSWFLLEAGHCLHPEASSLQGGTWTACEFPALVTVIHHPQKGWILFDTGYGEAFLRSTRYFPEALYRTVTPVRFLPKQAVITQLYDRGISPADVTTIIISHFHGDHVGGLADFPDAVVWCSSVGLNDLNTRTRFSALTKGLLPALVPKRTAERACFFESCKKILLVNELAPFEYGFDVLSDGSLIAIPLPGHAAGHFGLCFRSDGRWVFLVGDAAWSTRAIQENLPPPRWATALLGDTETYRKTLSMLHAMASRGTDVKFVPSHCRELRP
ncbi:MAG TPA: MBL fold metallo-hydrolase [Steroidobacteraceae bacterium]|nr:MBL fold metallo-hydrolase [Steroidobacteraceae bacterium]